MVEIVNLRQARKRAERGKADAKAAERRAAHGVPKHERERIAAERAGTRRNLDLHRLEPGDRE